MHQTLLPLLLLVHSELVNQFQADAVKWIAGHCQNGIAVTTKMIRANALKLAYDHIIEDYRGGITWCHNFMKRNGLCVCTKTKLA
jgi:hypothetical protein